MFRLFKKKKETVFQRISEELQQHQQIRKEFELTERVEGKLAFAPGAMDGMALYHFNGASASNEDFSSELLPMIIKYLESGSKKDITAIMNFIDSDSTRAIQTAEILVKKVLENADVVNAHIDRYAKLAHVLTTETYSVEAVKLGIIFSEPMIGPYGEKLVEPLKKLGYHDEFTYFCLLSLKNKLEKASHNQLCIEYASHSEGWGKVHSLSLIENPNKEQQEWIVRNGCSTGMLDMYLGHEALDKGNVRQLLKRDQSIDADLLDGITRIFLELLDDEGPLVGLEIVADDLSLIGDYLQQLDGEQLTKNQESVLEKLSSYLVRNYSEVSEGKTAIEKIQQLTKMK